MTYDDDWPAGSDERCDRCGSLVEMCRCIFTDDEEEYPR